MFSKRSEEKELLDDNTIEIPILRKNLDEMEWTNRLFGSEKLLLNALDKIYHKNRDYFTNYSIKIADIGCGSGDLLRAIEVWAKHNKIQVDLTGIDIALPIIQYAMEKSPSSNIHYKIGDVLSPDFNLDHFDVITLNSVCHHFNNDQLSMLFSTLKKQARLAIIMNDLQRHWLSYYLIKWLTFCCHFSYPARHDGPLSILRAFDKNDLIELMQQANIHNYQLQKAWAFRWQAIIWR